VLLSQYVIQKCDILHNLLPSLNTNKNLRSEEILKENTTCSLFSIYCNEVNAVFFLTSFLLIFFSFSLICTSNNF